MRRFRKSGGVIPPPASFFNNYQELDQANRGNTNNDPSYFYPERLRFMADVANRLAYFIKLFLTIPDYNGTTNLGTYNHTTYSDIISDFKIAGNQIAKELGINNKAPIEFLTYLATFVAYDLLYIRGMNVGEQQDRNQQLQLAGMIRSVFPLADPDNFAKWETFYADFKSGKYSGGRTQWRARKAANTPYDPVDPIFDFSQEPKVKIPNIGRSAMATGDALYLLNAAPPTRNELMNSAVTMFRRGGSSRRAARSSRRRF